MGKGNYITGKENSGQYYVDNDFLKWYERETTEDGETAWEALLLKYLPCTDLEKEGWEYDDIASNEAYGDFLYTLKTDFMARYPSFVPCDEWPDRETHAIAENSLFYLAIADNEWSTAAVIYAKDLDDNRVGLQKRHCREYLDALKNILLDAFGEVYIRTCAWTSGIIRKEDVA